MRFILFVLVFSFLGSYCFIAKEYKLYFLGGQSNMTGYGYVSELPKEYKHNFKNIMIFEGSSRLDYEEDLGLGIWAILKPGHGVGFESDGISNHYSDRFGLELSFGKMIQELSENKNIAIIKYSRNGSSIDASSAGSFGCWEPNFSDSNRINQYDHFLATVRNAYSVNDIDGDGEDDILIPSGIIWMQGESDAANTYEVAKKYSKNLHRLINLIRAAFRNDNIPVAIGRITDSQKKMKNKIWKYGDIIRNEQELFVNTDHNSILVKSTDNYSYSDKWHYDSDAYIDLGNSFANFIYLLEKAH